MLRMIPKDGRRDWKSLDWTQRTPRPVEMYFAATKKHTKTKMLKLKCRRRTRNMVMAVSQMGHCNNRRANSPGHVGVVLVKAARSRCFPWSRHHSCRPFDSMWSI